MLPILTYDGNATADPASAVRQEVWDVRQSGSEGDFNTKNEGLQSILTKDLKAALDRRDPTWRGWVITY